MMPYRNKVTPFGDNIIEEVIKRLIFIGDLQGAEMENVHKMPSPPHGEYSFTSLAD